MRKSRLSQNKQDRLIEFFIAGSTARVAAWLVGVNSKTAVHYLHRLRLIVHHETATERAAMFGGEIEVDESYFGGKRGGRVYAQIIPDAKGATLMPIIEYKVIPDSIVFSDTFAAYNALDVAGFRHERINHSEAYPEDKNHINGIENFWSQAKRHLRKFNDVPKAHFGLYLRECEWRFNTPDPKRQLSVPRQWVQKNVN